MNAYDVNLDGFFVTEVGRVYGEVRDKILPYLRREREGAKALYASDAAYIEKQGRKLRHGKRIRRMEESGLLF